MTKVAEKGPVSRSWVRVMSLSTAEQRDACDLLRACLESVEEPMPHALALEIEGFLTAAGAQVANPDPLLQ